MPIVDIYEESQLKVKFKLLQASKSGTAQGRLTIRLDGQLFANHPISVKKQWAEHLQNLVKVPDDKENYTLDFSVTCATETVTHGTTYRVWPKNSVITVKGRDDSNSADTPFTLKYSDNSTQDHMTDGGGTCDCRLKKKLTFTIEPARGYEKLDPQPGVGRARTAKLVATTYTAKIASPDFTQETKVFLNVPSANAGDTLGHDAQGDEMVINLEGEADDGGDIAARVKAGDKYHIKMTLDQLSKRTDERIALQGVAGLTTTPNYKTHTATVDVAADGKAQFRVKFGPSGNEKCKIEVGTTAACADASLEFITRRKIGVQQYIYEGVNAISIADTQRAFDEVGIDVEAETDGNIDLDALPAGCVHPGNTFGLAYNRVLIIGDHNIRDVREQINYNHPWSTYTVYTAIQFDAGRARDTYRQTATLTQRSGVNFPGTGATRGTYFKVTDSERAILPVSLYPGIAPVRGTWTVKTNGTATPVSLTGDIPADHFHINYADSAHRNRLYVKVPAIPESVLAAGGTVEVSVISHSYFGPYLGWAPSVGLKKVYGVVIGLHADAGRSLISAAEMNKTIVHEVGHVLGQAPQADIAGLSRKNDHGYIYDGRGHSGTHCASGVSALTMKSGCDFGPFSYLAATCVMYGSVALRQKVTFCARCKPFVIAYKVQAFPR